MRHLIDMNDITTQEVAELIALAERMIADPSAFAHALCGKKLATLFFEPSTRTRLSFEAAMWELGGAVLGFSSADSSSAAKGESIADTVRTVGCYADIIAMRHPSEGAPRVAEVYSPVPIVNAGDGGHNHPTQTLTDLLTIHRERGGIGPMTIGLCGDLKFGRTVHSLIMALSRYSGINFVLISPPELEVPDYIKTDVLDRGALPWREVQRMEEVLSELDVLYMTRVQRERFFNEADYVRLKDSYILDPEKLEHAKKDLCIMHPLPRVGEISPKVDADPRACYFRQADNGKHIRKALIYTMLGGQA